MPAFVQFWAALPTFVAGLLAGGLLTSFMGSRWSSQRAPLPNLERGSSTSPPLSQASRSSLVLLFSALVVCALVESEQGPLLSVLRADLPAPTSSGREPRHALQLERILRWHDTPARHSSFRCTGGAQLFPQHQMNEGAATRDLRICVFSNVCLINKQVTFFVSPAESDGPHEMRLENQGSANTPPGFLWAGSWSRFIHGTALSIKFESSLPPELLERAENTRVYFLSELSLPSNYGHLLLDNVVPAYATAEMLGIDMRDVQLIGLKNCLESEVHMWNGWNLQGLSTEKTPEQLCQESLARWLPLLLEHPYDDTSRNRCFGTLVAGHEGVFASQVFAHRASAMRSMRERLLHSLSLPDVLPRQHQVLILQQRDYIQGFGSFPYSTLCENATSAVRGLSAHVKVTCIRPAELSVEEQMRQVLRATVIVTVHGSTSYSASMFACPGTSLLIAYSDAEGAPKIKEVTTTLFAIDLQVFHAPFSKLQGGNWAPYLLVALRSASERLGIAT